MLNPREQWCSKPSMIEEVKIRQEQHANKYASAKIFWEEFFTFLANKIALRENEIHNNNLQSLKGEFAEVIADIKQQQKDLYYGFQNNTTALADLCKLITSAKPTLIMKPNKKK